MEKERPLDCNLCQKPLSFCMREITSTASTTMYTCADCPHFKNKVYSRDGQVKPVSAETTLCCSHCHTSYEAIQRGEPLGCGECYQVFRDKIIEELKAASLWSPTRKKSVEPKKISMGQIGLKPNPTNMIKPSDEIYKLNQALNSALQKENYEEAASIRDQIKALLSKSKE